jgi:hypothetical protein
LKTNQEANLINPIEGQRQILDKLCLIVKRSCPISFQSARCRFLYEKFDDGSISVEQEFYFTDNNKEQSEFLNRDLRRSVMDLVKDLHAKMKSHTGGDWFAFTTTLNTDGKAKINFEYSADQQS